MDIDARRQRLDDCASQTGSNGVYWYGDDREKCPRCGVEVPAGYQLALPQSDVSGCLRCLEYQAHLAMGSAEQVPHDLIGTVNQQDALRQVAEQFRAYNKAAERGRPPPINRKLARERWTSRTDQDEFDASMPDDDSDQASRWSVKASRSRLQPDMADSFTAPKFKPRAQRRQPKTTTVSRHAKCLGLTEPRSREQIISAFRQSALICHPDYGGSAEAFRKIVEARDALLTSLEAPTTKPTTSKQS